MSGRSTITAAAFDGFFMKDTAAAAAGCGRVLPLEMFSALSVATKRQDACRVCFPFCFQYLLAAMLAAMLMRFCFLRTGFERERIFELPLFLDLGFFKHVAYVWKGKLAKDESEETVSLLSSGAKDFQVTSCGILAGFFPRAWRARVLEGDTEVHY